MVIAPAVAAIASGSVGVATANAATRGVDVLASGAPRLAPGHEAMLQAGVPRGASCRITLSRRGAPETSSHVRRAGSGLAQFSWTVPRDVASGTWRATVSCVHRGARSTSSVMLQSRQSKRRADGAAARTIVVGFPRTAKTPTAKGGGAYPGFGTLLVPGSSWLDGHGVNVYSDGGDGADGYYQCVELVNRLLTTLGWSPPIPGNANQLYGNASSANFAKHANGSGYEPVPGDIVVWGGGEGGFGHTAVVNSNSGGVLTVVEQNASPSGYNTYAISSSGSVAPTAYGYYVEGFLHPNADNIAQPAAPPTEPPPAQPMPAPAPAPARAETTGGVTNTWSDANDAGGTEGPQIPAHQTVDVACKVTGFTVQDGNSNWYRIASSPWNGSYYASADAFYNDGQTSGSLTGTPFVDGNVPNC